MEVKPTAQPKVVTPKRSLLDLAIGTVDTNAKLVEKLGDRQLWKTEKGKYGVFKIVANKYVPIARLGSVDEAQGKECLKTGIAPPKPVPAPKVPKEPKAAKPAAAVKK